MTGRSAYPRLAMDGALQHAARAALLELCDEGSPVVRTETVERTIAIGWRRWRSFERRHGRRRAHLEARVEDLAKGLRDAFEADRDLVGPLMEDYRHLALVLGAQFAQVGGTPDPSPD